ncbi:hypothetical protein P691DRAFT_351275 [Macrolepiota fuliginosa MF-IS2]|uniref:Uncharacterized protein n=1 Tax=Macrolepiota fuliginosa MF-IS2 TaxID=1400762 RepID=A0A9P5X4I2_9AGAR|nr:hypothetical protein P691DRAFT_351275 [Macrolepiota fuliginosa MF-IS2]
MPSWLAPNVDPLDALYRHFNVMKVNYIQGPLEERFEMVLTTLDGNLYPTHCLAVTQTNAPPNSPILILPVDSGLYAKGFSRDFVWPSEDDPPENPFEAEATDDMPVTIPQISEGPVKISLSVVSIVVPHPPSLPLLLLLGLGLETDVERLPYRLLPTAVVAEFPAPSGMAEVFAQFPEQQFERYYMSIGGLRGNMLSTGLKDRRIKDIVDTAWQVATSARRLRQHPHTADAAQRRR